MSESIMILGFSGSGKSYSLRNLKPEETLFISVDGKRPPFSMKGWAKLEKGNEGGSFYIPRKESIFGSTRGAMKMGAENGKKIIVIDDSQFLLANEFFRRAKETGYGKFTDLGKDFWDLMDYSRELPDDVVVYFMHHADKDADGQLKVKSIGKMLDEKGSIEGKFTVCLLCQKVDGQHGFYSQLDNSSIIKAPPEMMDKNPMENDLALVDQRIRDYWGI